MGREPSLEQVTQSPIQSSVEHLQGWGAHKISGQYFTSKWKCKTFAELLITKQKLQAFCQKWVLNNFHNVNGTKLTSSESPEVLLLCTHHSRISLSEILLSSTWCGDLNLFKYTGKFYSKNRENS